MEQEKKAYIQDNSFDIIDLILKNLKHLIILTLIGAIISGIVAFLLPPLFKSNTVIFPTILNTVSNHLYVTNFEYSKSSKRIGEEQQVEQMIQILKSNKVIEQANVKFKLTEHYKIDPNRRELYDLYEDYVSIKKTDLGSINITVLARTPQVAADLANFIASMADTVLKDLTNEYANQNLIAAKTSLQLWTKRVNQIEDSLNSLGEKGLIDIEMQIKEIQKSLNEAIKSNNAHVSKKFAFQLKNAGKEAGIFRSLKFQLEDASKILNKSRLNVDAAYTDLNAMVTSKLVISKASPAIKKSEPQRMLIIVGSSISTFFMSIVLLLILDFFKTRKYRQLN